MVPYRSKIFQFYLVRLFYSVSTFLLVYLYYPLPDFDFYSSSDSMEVEEVIDRTVFTKQFFSIASKVFLGNVILTNIFFLIILNYMLYVLHKKYENIFEKTKIHFAFLMPSIVLWSCIYSKELLFILIIVANLITLKLKWARWTKFLLFIILALGVCIMRVQFFPIFVLVNVFYCLKSDWAKLRLMVLSLISLIVAVVLVIPYIPILMESVYNYFFIVEGNSNRYWIEWTHSIDFFLAIPIAFYTSIFKFFPFEVVSNKLGIVFVMEGFFFMFIIFNALRYCRWVEIWFFLLVMLFTLLVNFPLNIFNPGSAMRYSSTALEIILFSFLYIINNKIPKLKF